MMQKYSIGRHLVGVCSETLARAIGNIPGFSTFMTDEGQAPEILFIYGDANYEEKEGSLLYSSENDGVVSEFYSTSSKGFYIQKMRHEGGKKLYMEIDVAKREATIYGSLMPQMLRFALWIGYGVMLSGRETIAIHSSCIIYKGKAVIFLGESGTGKSTHTRLWRENIDGAELLNDDSPIVRTVSDSVDEAHNGEVGSSGVFVYGSPWSGKTPCYRQEYYPLAAIVRLYQAPFNKIERLSLLMAYGAIHPSCPPDFAYDGELYDGISETIGKIMERVPVYRMGCLPNGEAAELSCSTIFGNGEI